MGRRRVCCIFLFMCFLTSNGVHRSSNVAAFVEARGAADLPVRQCSAILDGGQHDIADQDNCSPNEFCGYIPSVDDSLLRVCLPCDQCRGGGVGFMYSTDFLSYCTEKCECFSHDECGPGAYCDSLEPDNNNDNNIEGGRCKNCTDTDACTGPPNIFSHGKEDLCISSTSCGEHSFCSKIPSGNGQIGVCKRCAAYDCSVGMLQNDNESCDKLCPHQKGISCTDHDDCGRDGSWCSAEFRCNECSPYCFPRVSPDFDKHPFDSRCPVACCDWNFRELFDNNMEQTLFAVRPCESDLQIFGYWTRGDRSAWTVEEFLSGGTRCDVNPFMPYDGLRMATVVDCSGVADFEVPRFRTGTIALIAKEPYTERRSFLDDSFPHVSHYHGTLDGGDDGNSLSSGPDTSQQSHGPSVMFILLIVILAGMAGLILLFCIGAVMIIKSHRAAHSALMSSAGEEARLQDQIVPRDLIIDIMFPEQRLVVEEDDDDDDDDDEHRRVCTICLRQIEPGEAILTGGSCDHYYHRECIVEWMKCGSDNNFCPNCRRPLWTMTAYNVIQETLLALSGIRRTPAIRRTANGQR